MAWPLVVLATPSVLAGFWGIDVFLNRQFNTGDAPHAVSFLEQMFMPFAHAPLAALFGIAATVFGFSFAYALYAKAESDPLPQKLGALSRFMRDKFYFDEIYRGLVAVTHEALSRLANWFDQWIIAGLMVRGAHGTTEIFGRALRLLQTGNLQTYAFLAVAGVVVVILFVLK